MFNNSIIGFSIVVACVINACQGQKHEQRPTSFRTEGLLNQNELESGLWRYYNSNNIIYAEGNFSNGVRTGLWKYRFPKPDSIYWIQYFDTITSIKTNIPDFIKETDKSNSFIQFKNKDTAIIFNLVIAKQLVPDSISFSNYKDILYDDLINRKVTIVDSSSNYIETRSGKKYMYNFIAGTTIDSKNFIAHNIVGYTKDNTFIEISLRCDTSLTERSQKIFFSVIPNLFINGERFLAAQDTIGKIK